MALFGKRAPCAICGGKVKGLLPWHVDGQLVCDDCYGDVHLPDGMVNHMTLDDFRGYMIFREENDRLRQEFQITDEVDFGWFGEKFLFDMTNGLLATDKNLSNTIFEAKHITSFTISEDVTPLFEGSANGLTCYTSTVPETLRAMIPQIQQIQMHNQMQRNAERFAEQMNGDGIYYHETLDIPEPLRAFQIEIRLDHPYWSVFRAEVNGPRFNDHNPDVNEYLRGYTERVRLLDLLAKLLMRMSFPGAPVNAAPASAGRYVAEPTTSTGAVEELKRFKELMDLGVISEEDFAAQKRQLLGL